MSWAVIFIDPLIMFLAGWFAIVVSRNWSVPKPSTTHQQQVQLASTAKLLRILGPVLMVCAILFAGLRLLTSGVF
jgi:formate-dependent nitrite reductase membrane component NrfD